MPFPLNHVMKPDLCCSGQIESKVKISRRVSKGRTSAMGWYFQSNWLLKNAG